MTAKPLMKRLALIALLLPSIVMAEALTWLEKDNPNELWFLAVSTNCPVTDEALNYLVQGVLIRSRIKSAPNWATNGLHLAVFLDCFEDTSDSGRHVFDLDIQFRRFIERNDDYVWVYAATLVNYGTFGLARAEIIEQSVNKRVENAIADYLESNSYLGDD